MPSKSALQQSEARRRVSLSAADLLEIQGLVAQYNWAIDSGAVDDWVATFLPDGQFTNTTPQTWIGHDELRDFATNYAKDPEWQKCQHWVNNFLTEESGSDVILRCQLMTIQDWNGSLRIKAIAWYEDRLKRVNGRWKFAQRICRLPVASADPNQSLPATQRPI